MNCTNLTLNLDIILLKFIESSTFPIFSSFHELEENQTKPKMNKYLT